MDDAALAAALALEEAEAEGNAEGLAVDLLRRSGRDIHKSDPSDMKLLREAVAELRRVWAGNEPRGDWKLVTDQSEIAGLLVCQNFLDDPEVEALRTVMGAHRAWVHYAYGSTGRHGELASVVQRIDFGPRQVRMRVSALVATSSLALCSRLPFVPWPAFRCLRAIVPRASVDARPSCTTGACRGDGGRLPDVEAGGVAGGDCDHDWRAVAARLCGGGLVGRHAAGHIAADADRCRTEDREPLGPA